MKKQILVFAIMLSHFIAFAQAGKDGNLTVIALNTQLNTYTPVTANINSPTKTITVQNLSDLGTLNPGDLIMIYQAQGASISFANTASYGSVTALNSAGLYEFAYVRNTSGSTIIRVECDLTNNYTTAGYAQVIKVPQYQTLTINSGASVVPKEWGDVTGGRTGGVIAIMAENVVINGTINASTFGFRGGIVFNGTMSSGATVYTDFRNNSDPNYAGEKGESIAGNRIEYDALYNGRNGRGAPANGGGGGNAHNAGGGGGANGDNGNTWTGMGVMCSSCTGSTAWALDQAYIDNGNARTNSSGGGRGGYTFAANDENALTRPPSNSNWGGDWRDNTGGYGGRPLTTVPVSRIFFGGGGGAGDGNNLSNNNGGSGGGIIYLIASNNISGSGTLQSNGQNALPTVNTHNDAPGGGGGGGTIILRATGTIANTLTLNANGGNGGNQLITGNESEGPGGGGGGGVIAINTGAPTRTVTGGDNGTSTSTAVTEFPTNGATQGASGNSTTIAGPPTVCSVCIYPDQPTPNNNTVAFDGGVKTASATLPGSAPLGSFIRYYNAQVGGSTVSAPSQSAVGTYTVWAATVAMPDSCESNRVSVTLEIFSPGCPSFDYARGIEILESQIPGTGSLSNFPVLIDITNPDLRHTSYSGKIKNINGWDIRFTLDDGSTVLNHQIEFYDPVEGRLTVWVKVPTLSATANTMLYMFYGNSSIVTNTSSTSVWSGNNYEAVYHMSENPFATSITDHSGNGNSATPFNFTGDTRAVGKIGNSIQIFGTAQQHFRIQDGSSNVPANLRFNGATNITLSAWVRFIDFSSERIIIQKSWGDANNQIGYSLGRNNANVRTRISTSTANGAVTFTPSPAFVNTKYYHLAVTYDGTNIRSYVDGVLSNTTARTPGTGIISNASQALWIGRRSGTNTSISAYLDEIRVASDAKSQQWIETEFNNQNDPSTFYFIYPETPALTLCNNGVPSPVVDPEDFIFESRLCLDNIKVEGPLDFTDFPVLVSVQNNDLRTQAFGGQLLNPNGWDIGFRTEAGTMADFEIESYNPQTGQLIAWVKVPTLKTNTDTEIFLLYGNPNPVNDPSTSNTWSNGYRAVWHMKDNPFNDQVKDETGNGNTLVPFNFTSDRRVSGIIGQGIDLSAFSENYLQLGPTTVPSGSNLKFTGEQNITLSTWVKFNNTLTIRGIMEKAWGTGGGNTSWGIYRNGTAIRSRLNSSANGDINAGSTINTTDYFYLSMTYDGANVRTYRNGTLINTTARTGNIVNDASEIFTIGREFNTSNYLDAVVDEARVSGTVRSGDWLLTEYNNQSDPATFITCAFSPSPALPVTWLNFTAIQSDEKALLQWQTASEINNSHFEIYRSTDGINFKYLGQVAGNGNKNSPTAYYFYDEKPIEGINYYRLKQVDYDGKFEYSVVRQVEFKSTSGINLAVYPNPANNQLTMETNNEIIGHVKLSDFSGRVIFEKTINAKVFQIQLENINKGIYLLTHNNRKTYKIVKQ